MAPASNPGFFTKILRTLGGGFILLLSVSAAFATDKAEDSRLHDTEEKLTFNRSDFGRISLAVWSPLTEFENQILNSTAQLTQKNPETLLTFYLIASGDVRTQEQYQAISAPFWRWIADITPEITSIDDQKRRAEKLLQLMHATFFKENTVKKGAPSGYDADQSKLSDIFRNKMYNCISSALLFTVIAEQFGITTEGVLLPSHAFVQLNFGQGQISEVETTTVKGFEIKHDAKFYENSAEQWSEDLNLEPLTYQDYLSRKIVSPLQLGITNIGNQHSFAQNMAYRDRMRLSEIRAVLAPQDIEAQKSRLYFYSREFNFLNQHDDFSTMNHLFDSIEPWLSQQNLNGVNDPEWQSMLASTKVNRAYARVMFNREDEALVLAQTLLSETPTSTEDYQTIRQNIYYVLTQYMIASINQGGFTKAKRAIDGVESECLSFDFCAANLSALYARWSQLFWDQKDWPQVMRIIDEYLQLDSSSERSQSFWQSYERAHLNMANDFLYNENRHSAKQTLESCVERIKTPDLCHTALTKLEARGSF